jgi:hypothetical protein
MCVASILVLSFLVPLTFADLPQDGLVPWVHYIPVKEDLSDMEELIQFARENDDIARTIAQNGYDFVRKYLHFLLVC